MKPHKISANLDNSLLPIQKCHLNVCLNELKVCKVSRNPKSKRCWKFQLSTLTNKKVLFLKKHQSVPCTVAPWVALISAKRWRLDALTFLIHGFEDYLTNFMSCSILLKIQEQGGKKSIYGYLIGHITLFLPQYGSCNIKTVPYILLSINRIQVVKRQFYQGRFCILPNPSENSD